MNQNKDIKIKTAPFKYYLNPDKRLGQNFLLSKKALHEIILASELLPDDIVLEIGAGTGILTEALAKKAKKVIAIEKDKQLISILKERFKNHTNVEIMEGDARDIIFNFQFSISNHKFKIPNSIFQILNSQKYKVVANLPYYLSSFVIRQLLEVENKPKTIVLTLQKELAERICAKPGKMSKISVMARFYGTPSLGKVIEKTAFWPEPKVDSRIIVISDIKKPENIDEKLFSRIVRIGFSSRRKMLLGNLHNGLRISKDDLRKIFMAIGIDEKIRAQELSIEEWKMLTKTIPNF